MPTSSDDRDWAVVASSLRRRDRPYDLVHIGQAIERLVARYGADEVALRAGVSKGMLRQFMAVLTLPPEVRKLARSRRLDSVSALSYIARLRDPEDQVTLAHIVEKGGLSAGDVKDIVQNANRDARSSIAQVVDRVLAARPKRERVYVIVMDRAPGTDPELPIRLRKLGASRVHAEGGRVFVIADESGMESLRKEAARLRVPVSGLAEALQEGRA